VRVRVALATLALAGSLGSGPVRAASASAAPTSAPSAGPSPTEARAAERRQLFVGIVGGALLVFGVLGAWLALRSRRRRPEPVPEPATEPPPPPPKVLAVPTRGTPAKTEILLQCPTCRRDFGPDALFCSRDGNRLVPVRDGIERGPTGGVCPICKQGYDPGVQVCPIHEEELIPAPLFEAEPDSSGASPKICPTCGVQYRNGSGFCGADGSALVTVN